MQRVKGDFTNLYSGYHFGSAKPSWLDSLENHDERGKIEDVVVVVKSVFAVDLKERLFRRLVR